MRRRATRDPAASARRSIPDPGLRAQTLAHPEAGPLLAELQSITLSRLGERLAGTLNDVAQVAALPSKPPSPPAVRMLVIHGTADPVVPFDHAARLAGPANLFAIEGGGHVALFTHLDAVRARARLFLSHACVRAAAPELGRLAVE